ncbi:hypothetical protein [Methyloferula stellata]|uniref:hypothetical protein n=1 Tax=Methyloferula stellata TaxID=876270 RepID=UPI000366C225|nr:hypothetical protein [Methyloferula stellata]
MPAPAKPFGRRNLPFPPPASRPAAVAAASDAAGPAETRTCFSDAASIPESEALLKFNAALAEERQKALQDKTAGRTLVVPASGRAAFLAGLVVAFLHAGLDLGASVAMGQRLGTLSIDGRTIPIVPLILLGSLWSGAESSAIGLFFVRTLLAPLRVTHIAAYAICGGFVALAYAAIMHTLGWGDYENLQVDIVMGVAAGFFYRLFAGTRPA